MPNAKDDLTLVPDLMTVLHEVQEADSFEDLQRCMHGLQQAVPETSAKDIAYFTDVLAHLHLIHEAARDDSSLANIAGDAAVLITRLIMHIGTRAMTA